ncbi:MAG: GNAT family N-acetyltransferase [Ruminiclostridium sp.]
MIALVYELKDTSKVKELFCGWQETLIYSCLQKVMGKIYVTDTENPVSAFAFVGCFAFFAGKPDRELVINKPDGFVIMTPQNKEWAALIEECYPSANRVTRYAIKKDTVFDKEQLEKEIAKLPTGYELRQIDSEIYDKCLQNPVTADFVSAFDSKEHYLEMGRGMVILKDGNIVSGASSYTRYNEGIEIEVDTVESERRKHFATIVCSALILKCLDEGLYPSWDAHNMNSVHLAEKLGYEFDHEYIAYEVASEERTH